MNKEKTIKVESNSNNPLVYQHEIDVLSGKFDHCPLVVKGLTKEYIKGERALDELTFAVEAGTCFGLLGPNGSGKTTLLSILYGLLLPTSGSAKICGKDLTKAGVFRKHIGVSMQFDVLWDTLTTSEHLYFYARAKGIQNTEEHVADLLNSVSLVSKRDSQAKDLSGGMRRRLSLAIAMIGSPSVVFLDEPTTGLDPVSKRDVWNAILKFQRDRAIIVTTHDMDEASAICSKLAVVNRGELIFIGEEFEFREQLESEFKYVLELQFIESSRDKAIDFITRLVGEDQLVKMKDDIEGIEGKISYGVGKDASINTIWNGMREQDLSDFGITEWQLGETSLETLFLQLINSQAIIIKDKKQEWYRRLIGLFIK
ncbi:ABC transporter A family protein [Acrasis kona]|uniref:ABC transporter A family protein n=1 Tax=Acrasis kona TaxID=1008807 RepID=A0AAW2ZNS9_9EUKA